LPAPVAASAHGEIERSLVQWAQHAAKHQRGQTAEATLYERFLELGEPPVLRAALAHCHGNRAAAAQLLGMHRATLRQKLRKYDIE
jgi:two-component system nitrogen regulation response regulator GlnG